MNLRDIANRTIPPPLGKSAIIHQQGDTGDIISVILEADAMPQAQNDTVNFAPYFAPPTLDKLEKLWHFTRHQIKYIADKEGHERVKLPSATWAEGYADCKSLSLLIGSILRNLGVPFVYRFAAYNGNPNVTHVYPVAYFQGREIILDAVHHRFNEEEPYSYVVDYDTTPLAKVAGNEPAHGFSLGGIIKATGLLIATIVLIKLANE